MDMENVTAVLELSDGIPVSSPSGAESGAGGAEADLREELSARAEAEGLMEIYPDFDLDVALSHPISGPLLRGESRPTLRQVYELAHMEELIESRVRSRLDAEVASALAAAIPEAVASAVAASEERLLGHISARGQRPPENGTSASAGIRVHPAVDRLTRRERALLAERAGRGENVRL